MEDTEGHDRRAAATRYVDLALGAAMLIMAFLGIGSSDIYGGGAQTLWTFIALGFACAHLAMDWMHSDAPHRPHGVLHLALHWLAVIAAIQLVYVLIAAGRLMNADDGLTNGVILALGAFLGGVWGNWRMLVIGAAVGLAVAAVAFVEQYLWALIGTGVVALGAVFLIARLRRPRRDAARRAG